MTDLSLFCFQALKQIAQRHLIALIEQNPRLEKTCQRPDLEKALGCSDFFASVVKDDVLFLERLFNPVDKLDKERFYTLLKTGESFQAMKAAFCRFRKEECAKIIWQMVTKASTEDSYLSMAKRLTELADFLIQQAFECTRKNYDLACAEKKIIVIALGKLGAEEINFSSDVDLMIVAQDELAEQEINLLVKWVQRTIQLLHTLDQSGFVYRVDLRLRPFGHSGPLILGMNSVTRYYVEHGRAWERYALMRARVIYGEAALAARFLKFTHEFVYRAYHDFGVSQTIRTIQKLITQEAKLKRFEQNLKLGPGGIREVEFIVQSGLLTYGHRPAFRKHNMLAAFEVLIEQGIWNSNQLQRLKEAYIFLRQAENAVQMFNDQQTHTIPSDEIGQARLACLLGFETIEACFEKCRQTREFVQSMFQLTLHPEQASVFLPVQNAKAAFEKTVFPPHFQALLDQLCLYYQHSKDVPDDFIGQIQTFFSQLIKHFQGRQAYLKACYDLLSCLKGRKTYLQLVMEKPSVLINTVTLMVQSGWIYQGVLKHPFLLAHIFTGDHIKTPSEGVALEKELETYCAEIDWQDLEKLFEHLRHFKWMMQLRIAVADLTNQLTLMRVSDHLTGLAEVILRFVLKLAWYVVAKRHEPPKFLTIEHMGLAIIAYGKLGGLELSYQSDLDLVFLYESPGSEAQEKVFSFYTKLTQKFIAFLTTKTYSGELYKVDLRLRPSGQSGLLVSSFEAFEKYQLESAWTWEHQALIRARAVAGESRLGQQFEMIRRKVLVFHALHKSCQTLKADIQRMRERIFEQVPKDEQQDLKYIEGGLVDIEFITQYLGLLHAATFPKIIAYPDMIRILEACIHEQLLPQQEGQELIRIYRAYRQALHYQTLKTEEKLMLEDFQEERIFIMRLWRKYFKN